MGIPGVASALAIFALLTHIGRVSGRGACTALRGSCPTLAVLCMQMARLGSPSQRSKRGWRGCQVPRPSVVVAADRQGCVGVPHVLGKGGVLSLMMLALPLNGGRPTYPLYVRLPSLQARACIAFRKGAVSSASNRCLRANSLGRNLALRNPSIPDCLSGRIYTVAHTSLATCHPGGRGARGWAPDVPLCRSHDERPNS